MTDTTTVPSTPKTRKLPTKRQLVTGSALVVIGAVGTLAIIAATKKAPVVEVAAALADTAV